MKNEILDVPFRNSFPDFLSKGETVLWEGHPTPTKFTIEGNPIVETDGYEKYMFWAITIFGTSLLFFKSSFRPLSFIYFLLMVFIIKIFPWWKARRKKNIHYAITQKQILFQFKEKWFEKKTFYAIPFSEIKHIIVTKTYDFDRMTSDSKAEGLAIPHFYDNENLKNLGSIFIVVHQPELIPFETKDLINNNKRHQPTLELLDDVEAVAKLIQEGIQNANTLL